MTNRNEVGPFAAGLVCFHQLSTGTKANAPLSQAAHGQIRCRPLGHGARPPAVCGSRATRWSGRVRAPVSFFAQGARFRRWRYASHRSKGSPRVIDRFVARRRRYTSPSEPLPILSISSCDPGLPWGSPIARQGLSRRYAKGFCGKLRLVAQQKRRF
jgi:hypothetical protein